MMTKTRAATHGSCWPLQALLSCPRSSYGRRLQDGRRWSRQHLHCKSGGCRPEGTSHCLLLAFYASCKEWRPGLAENASSIMGVYWDYNGLMEKKMDTTKFRVCIGVSPVAQEHLAGLTQPSQERRILSHAVLGAANAPPLRQIQ